MMINSRSPVNINELLQRYVDNVVGKNWGRELIKISTRSKNKHNLGGLENENDVWASVNKVDSREYLSKMKNARHLLEDIPFGYIDTVLTHKATSTVEKRYDSFRIQFKDIHEIVFSEGKITSQESLYDTATNIFRSGVVAGEIKKAIAQSHNFGNTMPPGQKARSWKIDIDRGSSKNLTTRTFTTVSKTFEKFKVGSATYADDRYLIFFKNEYAHIISWLLNHMDSETFKLHPSSSDEFREPFMANILIKGKENLNFFKLNHNDSIEMVIPYSTAAEILHTYGIGGKLV